VLFCVIYGYTKSYVFEDWVLSAFEPFGIYHWDKSAGIILKKVIKTDLSAKARNRIFFGVAMATKEFCNLLKYYITYQIPL